MRHGSATLAPQQSNKNEECFFISFANKLIFFSLHSDINIGSSTEHVQLFSRLESVRTSPPNTQTTPSGSQTPVPMETENVQTGSDNNANSAATGNVRSGRKKTRGIA